MNRFAKSFFDLRLCSGAVVAVVQFEVSKYNFSAQRKCE